MIFTFPRLYAVSALPFTPVTGLPANTSHFPSEFLYTFDPKGIVFPAPSAKSVVVVNSSDTLYISPVSAKLTDGKFANVTVPFGLSVPANDSDMLFVCS